MKAIMLKMKEKKIIPIELEIFNKKPFANKIGKRVISEGIILSDGGIT